MKILKYFLSLPIILLLFMAAGCQNEPINIMQVINANEFSTSSTNSVIHQAQANEPEDCLLYIIHEPTDEELSELLSYTMLKLNEDEPLTLLAPREQKSMMKIYNLNYNEETESYERGLEVWSLDSTNKGFIAAAQMKYGQPGQPVYELYIEINDSYGSYFFELPAEEDTMPHIDYLVKQGTVITVKGLD